MNFQSAVGARLADINSQLLYYYKYFKRVPFDNSNIEHQDILDEVKELIDEEASYSYQRDGVKWLGDKEYAVNWITGIK